MLLVRLILFFFNNNSILYCERASNGSDNEMLSPVAHGNNSNISDTLILVCRKKFWNIYQYSRYPSIRFYKCTNTCSRRELRHWHISDHTLKDRSNKQLHKAGLHTWVHRKSDVKQVTFLLIAINGRKYKSILLRSILKRYVWKNQLNKGDWKYA